MSKNFTECQDKSQKMHQTVNDASALYRTFTLLIGSYPIASVFLQT